MKQVAGLDLVAGGLRPRVTVLGRPSHGLGWFGLVVAVGSIPPRLEGVIIPLSLLPGSVGELELPTLGLVGHGRQQWGVYDVLPALGGMTGVLPMPVESGRTRGDFQRIVIREVLPLC